MRKVFTSVLCCLVGMVALTSVAAMPSVTLNAIDFANEDLWGKMPRYGLDEAGREEDPSKFTGICYWYYGGTNGNGSVITDYSRRTGEGEAYDGFGERNPKPFYMHERVVNEGFLDVGSLAPLCRTFNEASSNGVSAAQSIPAKNDLFVDALVKFVPRFVEPGEIPDDGLGGKAKFMVCLATSAADPSQTNLLITAGHYDAAGVLSARTYMAENKVQPNKWYRLTARAFRNAASNDGQKEPAFALFLDGALVTCAAGAYEIGEDAAKVRETFAGNEYYSKRALFPPLRAFEPTPKLSGFAMRGCAGVDDFGVVVSGNPLSRSANEIEMTVAIDPQKVTGVVCTVGGAQYALPEGEGEMTFPVGRGARVEIAATAREGYLLHDGLTVLGNMGAVASVEGRVITLAGEFDDASRVVARINAGDAYFLVGGQAFERMDDAIEAAAQAADRTLALGKPVTLDPTTENGQMRVKAGYEITLDLRGQGITGEHFMDESTIYDQGRLTVVDSVGGGFIHAPGTAIEVVNTNAALVANHEFAVLTLGSEALADKVWTVRGRVRCDRGQLVVKGGTYLTPRDLEPTDEFYLAGYVPDSRYVIAPVGEPEIIEGRACRYWGVTYDGKMMVRFKVEHGTVSPEWVTVAKGSTVDRPYVEATGYTILDWVDEATGRSWNFELDTVEEDVTIAARQEIDVYSIDYAGATISPLAPDSYTLEMERTLIPPPSKARENYIFAGWLAEGKGKFVDFVGKGAVYVGTTERVIGDLKLIAQWTPAKIVWTNAGSGLSESNGTYAGSWSFTIPAKGSISSGDRIVIDRISLCVVNPHLYPKTAARMAVTNVGLRVVSRPRTYEFNEETKEYGVARRLLNGRAAVDYEFDDLVVEADDENFVCLTDLETNPVRGFLRFTLQPAASDAVFGNCTQPGGAPECARYMEFCPTYEVSGHLEEGTDE